MTATLVIDGGGSTTDVAVVRSGRIVARTTAPSFKPTAADPRTDDLCRLIGTFLVSQGFLGVLDRVLVGMAGVWGDHERFRYLQAFELSWTQYVDVTVPTAVVLSDAELVLHAGLPQPTGMVLIAGTGAIAVGRTGDGILHRCGGWGPRIDDAGGGFWLGREALRAVARMVDGRGADTLLIRPAAAYLRIDHSDHVMLQARLRTTPVDGAARLGRAVLTYADEGDGVARNIRHRGATELAELIRALRRQHKDLGDHVVCYGSLLQDAGYRALVERYSIDGDQDLVFEPLADVMGALAASA